MWCLWIVLLVSSTFARRYRYNPADPIIHKETNAKTVKDAIIEMDNFNANALFEDGDYYDDDDADDEYQNDMLMLYDEFDDTDYSWNNDLEWDEINTITLENNQIITQKCAYWTASESFCLCKFTDGPTKYECKENAAKKAYNVFDDEEWDKEEDSSDEWWEMNHPDDLRNPISDHHVFNQGLKSIPKDIEGDLQKIKPEVQYQNQWNYQIPLDIAEIIFAHKLSEPAIVGRLKKLRLDDTAQNRITAKGAILDTVRSLNFGALINFYQFKVKNFMGKPGYRYLGKSGEFDANSMVFQRAIEDLRKAITNMIEGGASHFSTTKPALVREIQKFIAPFDEIRIKGLKRWYTGGIHAGRGAEYGSRGYSVSYPQYMDGPIVRFMFEHDDSRRRRPIATVNPHNGAILNQLHYTNWILMKQFDEFIVRKLKGIPGDIERLLR